MNLDFNIQSFIQPVLYILNKAGKPLDTHKISKILYFADREHLAKYGTSITDDSYIAMKYGPVPSTIYDIIKAVLGSSEIIPEEVVNNYFEKFSEKEINALAGYDEDEFSQSEIECLDNSLKKYLNRSFSFLTNESHDLAWIMRIIRWMFSKLQKQVVQIEICSITLKSIMSWLTQNFTDGKCWRCSLPIC